MTDRAIVATFGGSWTFLKPKEEQLEPRQGLPVTAQEVMANPATASMNGAWIAFIEIELS